MKCLRYCTASTSTVTQLRVRAHQPVICDRMNCLMPAVFIQILYDECPQLLIAPLGLTVPHPYCTTCLPDTLLYIVGLLVLISAKVGRCSFLRPQLLQLRSYLETLSCPTPIDLHPPHLLGVSSDTCAWCWSCFFSRSFTGILIAPSAACSDLPVSSMMMMVMVVFRRV
jgi:hypothetical protein